MFDNWNSQHSFNCQFVEQITDIRQETVTTKSNHEKASACHSHLFFFRLLVITIKKHGGINGHIRSYNCWRGRPETLCRGTATGTCLCVMVSPSTWFSDHPDIKNSSKSNQPLISVFQDAKQDDISAHFQSFGELDNINLKTDPATGRSRWEKYLTPSRVTFWLIPSCRGFAFVVFKTVEGLKDAVASEEHTVKGKKVWEILFSRFVFCSTSVPRWQWRRRRRSRAKCTWASWRLNSQTKRSKLTLNSLVR